MHVHVGALEFFQFALYAIIFGFMWRSLSARWSENSVGKAMSFIY